MESSSRIALLGIADADVAERLSEVLLRSGESWQILLSRSLELLQARLTRTSPRAILLDESVLGGVSLSEALLRLTAAAPVVLLADPKRQSEAASWVSKGDVEFVARVGAFVPLAAALIERRAMWAEQSSSWPGAPWSEFPPDFAEILRHEINNPLTGILGNAELLLAHREKLPPAAVRRLETVVDLAVRLREIIRRLSSAWESQRQVLRSA